MKVVQTYEQFINEAKIQIKQKYTDKHPAKTVNSYAPVREKIISFIKENSPVSQKQLIEFVKGVNEETGGNTSIGWINRNKQYFKVQEVNGEKLYKLSALGERVYTAGRQLNKD